MLTRLVVDLYAWIIEFSMWLLLVASGIAGYRGGVPLLNAAGWAIEDGPGAKFFGVILFVLVAFLVLAMLTGPLLILVDIRKSMRTLEQGKASDKRVKTLPIEYREPSL